MVTAKEAQVWVRGHPDAGIKEAESALPGITKTTFYKARRLEKLEKLPSSGNVLSLPPPPVKETKTSRMIVWLQQHPGATAKDAVAAGLNSGIYYFAKAKMEGRPYKSSRKKATSIVVRERRNGIVQHLAANSKQQRILDLIMHLGLETLATELSSIREHMEDR